MESVRKGEVRRDATGKPLASVDLTPEGRNIHEPSSPACLWPCAAISKT